MLSNFLLVETDSGGMGFDDLRTDKDAYLSAFGNHAPLRSLGRGPF